MEQSHDFWEVGKSGSREVGKSGSREVGKSGSREVGKRDNLNAILGAVLLNGFLLFSGVMAYSPTSHAGFEYVLRCVNPSVTYATAHYPTYCYWDLTMTSDSFTSDYVGADGGGLRGDYLPLNSPVCLNHADDRPTQGCDSFPTAYVTDPFFPGISVLGSNSGIGLLQEFTNSVPGFTTAVNNLLLAHNDALRTPIWGIGAAHQMLIDGLQGVCNEAIASQESEWESYNATVRASASLPFAIPNPPSSIACDAAVNRLRLEAGTGSSAGTEISLYNAVSSQAAQGALSLTSFGEFLYGVFATFGYTAPTNSLDIKTEEQAKAEACSAWYNAAAADGCLFP